jgi:hypothetical protein
MIVSTSKEILELDVEQREALLRRPAEEESRSLIRSVVKKRPSEASSDPLVWRGFPCPQPHLLPRLCHKVNRIVTLPKYHRAH